GAGSFWSWPYWSLDPSRAVYRVAASGARRGTVSVDIEERLAHLERLSEELSDVVSTQGTEIAALKQQVALLIEREAQREAAESGGVILGDERPPHY
ncbi:MAG: SlyX family protein, partial [Boseongicola sp.]